MISPRLAQMDLSSSLFTYILLSRQSKSIISCETTFILSAATSYNGNDPALVCKKYLSSVIKKSYTVLRDEHIADYRELFRRVELNLRGTKAGKMPTDERLKAIKKGDEDPELFALYFQFGRYLLISSSRPGTLPANLQGIWNESTTPAWESKWTTNINVEINY